MLRKLDLMHHLFGVCQGHSCRECGNLIKGEYHDRTLRKCQVYGLTHSEASDWAGKWQACGMFNCAYTGRPVIETVKGRHKREKQDGPLDGQIRMEM